MVGIALQLQSLVCEKGYKPDPEISKRHCVRGIVTWRTKNSHTRECALKCAKSGFGIVTSDQKFLKFDAEGNTKILEELKASDKKDHLRVNVDGDVQGDTLKVTSIKLL
jgi:hypothetical protein